MENRGGCGIMTIITNMVFFIGLLFLLGSCTSLFNH